ncbi:hypothetical protein MD484_g8808, partial [Candolleomyces efflorescens]
MISPELFRFITDGSYETIVVLLRVLGISGNNVDVLDAALQNLQSELVPSRCELSTATRTTANHETAARRSRADASLSIVLTVIEAFNSQASLGEIPFDRLAPSIDGICRWIRHLILASPLNYRSPSESRLLFDITGDSYLALLSYMVSNEGLRAAITTSQSFLDLLLSLWLVKDRNGGYLYWLTPNLSHCPLSLLFVSTIRHEDGRQALVDRLVASGVTDSALTDSLVQRCHQVNVNETKGTLRPQLVLNYLGALLKIAECVDSINPGIRRRLLATGFFHRFLSTLEGYSREIYGSESRSDADNLRLITGATCQLVELCQVAGLNQVAGGPFFAIALRTLEFSDDDKDIHWVWVWMILRVVLHVKSEQFGLRTLNFENLPVRDPKKIRDIPALAQVWKTIEDVKDYTQALQECARLRGGEFTAVGIISNKCQKRQDWNARHRLECSAARAGTKYRRPTDVARLRGFLLGRMVRSTEMQVLYFRLEAEVEEYRSENLPHLAPHEVVTVFFSPHERAWDASWGWLVIPRCRWYKALTQFTDSFLEPRISSLEEELSSGSNSETRIVEVVHKCASSNGTTAMVFLTMKLQLGCQARFEPAYTIVKSGSQKCAEELGVPIDITQPSSIKYHINVGHGLNLSLPVMPGAVFGGPAGV